MRARELRSLQENQEDESALRQGFILDQLEAFRKCMKEAQSGHSRRAISDPSEKNNIRHGCCRAFSLLNGLMHKLDEKDWWNAMLVAVRDWDREASSLSVEVDTKRTLSDNEIAIPVADIDDEIKKPVVHTGAGFPQALTLQKIFEIVDHNILFVQSHRYKFIPGNENDQQRTRDYLFSSEIKFRDLSACYEALTDKPYYVVGNFNLDRLMQLLKHKHFKAALKSSVCLVYSATHACRLYMDGAGKVYFYDPNFDDGKAKPYPLNTEDRETGLLGCELLFNRLDRSLGEGVDNIALEKPVGDRTIDLGFELVSTSDFTANPFQGYWDGMEKQPFDYLSFKNFKKKSTVSKNFAKELQMGGLGYIEAVMNLVNDHLKNMELSDRIDFCRENARSFQDLIGAAISFADKTWLNMILESVYSPVVMQASKMTAILDAIPSLNKTQRGSYEALINKRRNVLLNQKIEVTECSQSLYPRTNDPQMRAIKKLKRIKEVMGDSDNIENICSDNNQKPRRSSRR